MLAWLVLTVKLVAVPVTVQVTPPEPVKHGSPLHAPEAWYVLLSTKYASWAVAALRASAATRALKPRDRYAENCGIAIAARMPMMATTTSSSISVKPLDFFRFILETLCILSPLAGWVLVLSRLMSRRPQPLLGPRSKRGATRRVRGVEGRRGEKPQIRCKNGRRGERAPCTRMSPDRHETDARHHSIAGSAQGAHRGPTRRRGALERRRGDRQRAARRCGRAIRGCPCCNRIAR